MVSVPPYLSELLPTCTCLDTAPHAEGSMKAAGPAPCHSQPWALASPGLPRAVAAPVSWRAGGTRTVPGQQPLSCTSHRELLLVYFGIPCCFWKCLQFAFCFPTQVRGCTVAPWLSVWAAPAMGLPSAMVWLTLPSGDVWPIPSFQFCWHCSSLPRASSSLPPASGEPIIKF